MAKKVVKKSKKTVVHQAPVLDNNRPRIELVGSCKCGTPAMVRIPHHVRLQFQMVTAFCRSCSTTFYLIEAKED